MPLFLTPRRFPDLGDIFYEEIVEYFKDQVRDMSQEVGEPRAWLPYITGRLTASTFVDLDLDSRQLGGDDLVTVQFVVTEDAPYAPDVQSLGPAIDRYLEAVVYPRWKQDIEGGDI